MSETTQQKALQIVTRGLINFQNVLASNQEWLKQGGQQTDAYDDEEHISTQEVQENAMRIFADPEFQEAQEIVSNIGATLNLPIDPANDAPVAAPQRPLLGVQPLSDEQVILINTVTEKGNELGQLINVLEITNKVEPGQPQPYDGRWLAIGKTHLQEGLMAIRRAISNSTHF